MNDNYIKNSKSIDDFDIDQYSLYVDGEWDLDNFVKYLFDNEETYDEELDELAGLVKKTPLSNALELKTIRSENRDDERSRKIIESHPFLEQKNPRKRYFASKLKKKQGVKRNNSKQFDLLPEQKQGAGKKTGTHWPIFLFEIDSFKNCFTS